MYVGLFGQSYGFEDTEREFDRVTARGKPRLIFVKGADDTGRHPKMQALTRKVGTQLIRRRFTSVPDPTAALYANLIEHLERGACCARGRSTPRPVRKLRSIIMSPLWRSRATVVRNCAQSELVRQILKDHASSWPSQIRESLLSAVCAPKRR